MKRRRLLMLAGGTAATAAVLGATAPPAQAIFPLLLRVIIGAGVRRSLRRKAKAKKGRGAQGRLRSRRIKKGPNRRQRFGKAEATPMGGRP